MIDIRGILDRLRDHAAQDAPKFPLGRMQHAGDFHGIAGLDDPDQGINRRWLDSPQRRPEDPPIKDSPVGAHAFRLTCFLHSRQRFSQDRRRPLSIERPGRIVFRNRLGKPERFRIIGKERSDPVAVPAALASMMIDLESPQGGKQIGPESPLLGRRLADHVAFQDDIGEERLSEIRGVLGTMPASSQRGVDRAPISPEKFLQVRPPGLGPGDEGPTRGLKTTCGLLCIQRKILPKIFSFSDMTHQLPYIS